MIQRAFVLAVLTALSFGAPVAHAAECNVNRRPLVVAANAEVDMIVKSGRDCRIRFPAEEGFEPERGEIVDRPSHGGARMNGSYDIYYRSNPGYKGSDRFSFVLCGADYGKRGCSEIRVRINVR